MNHKIIKRQTILDVHLNIPYNHSLSYHYCSAVKHFELIMRKEAVLQKALITQKLGML
jgi:hypothetical protein